MPRKCPYCGYDMSGASSKVCPECGKRWYPVSKELWSGQFFTGLGLLLGGGCIWFYIGINEHDLQSHEAIRFIAFGASIASWIGAIAWVWYRRRLYVMDEKKRYRMVKLTTIPFAALILFTIILAIWSQF